MNPPAAKKNDDFLTEKEAAAMFVSFRQVVSVIALMFTSIVGCAIVYGQQANTLDSLTHDVEEVQHEKKEERKAIQQLRTEVQIIKLDLQYQKKLLEKIANKLKVD